MHSFIGSLHSSHGLFSTTDSNEQNNFTTNRSRSVSHTKYVQSELGQDVKMMLDRIEIDDM